VCVCVCVVGYMFIINNIVKHTRVYMSLTQIHEFHCCCWHKKILLNFAHILRLIEIFCTSEKPIEKSQKTPIQSHTESP